MGVLRLFLALSVVVSHAGGAVYGYQLIEPQVAVALFFVVSGFYMSFIINEKYSVLPNGTSRFYLNRFLRLYPTYLAVLVAVVLFQTVTRKNNVFYNPAPDVDGFHRLIYSLLIFLIVGQDYVSGRGDCSLLQ